MRLRARDGSIAIAGPAHAAPHPGWCPHVTSHGRARQVCMGRARAAPAGLCSNSPGSHSCDHRHGIGHVVDLQSLGDGLLRGGAYQTHHMVRIDFLLFFGFLLLFCHNWLLFRNALPFGEGAPRGGRERCPEGAVILPFQKRRNQFADIRHANSSKHPD